MLGFRFLCCTSVKKNKAVILLSTMHSDNEVNEVTGKPVVILDYSEQVDRVDSFVITTVSKKNKG